MLTTFKKHRLFESLKTSFFRYKFNKLFKIYRDHEKNNDRLNKSENDINVINISID